MNNTNTSIVADYAETPYTYTPHPYPYVKLSGEIPSKISFTCNAGQGGTVEPEGTNEYSVNTIVTFNAIPGTNYTFDRWLMNGEINVVETQYTTPLNLRMDSSLNGSVLTATFKKTQTGYAFSRGHSWLQFLPYPITDALFKIRDRLIQPHVHNKLHPLI